MTQGLRDIQAYDVVAALEHILVPRLAEQLHHRGPGHCMRVTDLEVDLMVRLCGRLRAEVPGANIVVLSNGRTSGVPVNLAVTSTKLVELRNPLANGTLRPPLLVFVPNDVRAAAEDSFGVATFEDIQVGDVYRDLREQLLREVPASLRGALVEGLQRLENGVPPWPFADPVAIVRFLLTGKVNDGDPAAYGGALYELGLIPDFELLQDPARAPQRLLRNRECVATLTWSPKSERGRVLDLQLSQRAFRQQLGNFLADAGLEDPRAWTRRIVLDRNLWPLAFHRWEFEDGGQEPDALYIGNVTTDLPIVPDNVDNAKLAQLIGQQILPLGGGGLKKFSVRFRVDPHPGRVQGLAKFVLQVFSQERGPVGLVRSKSIWKTAAQQTTVSFTRLNRVAWEEGWHSVRVLAQTTAGDLIPLVDEVGTQLPWTLDESETPAIRPNQSDLFYVLPDDEVEVEPVQHAVPREISVSHAALRLQFTALQEGRAPETIMPAVVTWAERHPRGRAVGTDVLEAQFPREGAFHVPVSHPLKLAEQKILATADGPLYWRIPIALGVAGPSTGEVTQWPQIPAIHAFLTARRQYFEALRSGVKELVTQGTDLRSVRDDVMAYASAYLALLQELGRRLAVSDTVDAQRAFADLRKMLALDSVFLAVTDHRDRRREATLISSTHPLRALWLVVWAELGRTWLEAMKTAPGEFAGPTRDALLRQLAPVAFPPVLPTDTGHILTAVDNLNPFWTLYAPSHEEDPRGLLGDICAAFGLPEPTVGGTVIDGAYLATRVQRYLLQHPYVHTLSINAFNAVRATILADMLLHIQQLEAFADLCYDIRLFVPDAEAPGVGEALAALLSPQASLTAQEANAFATPTVSHLHSKLRLAIRSTYDFRHTPERHPAHISLLFDLFPAEDVDAAKPSSCGRNSPSTTLPVRPPCHEAYLLSYSACRGPGARLVALVSRTPGGIRESDCRPA